MERKNEVPGELRSLVNSIWIPADVDVELVASVENLAKRYPVDRDLTDLSRLYLFYNSSFKSYGDDI
ncbi:MAG: hypothetical protein LC114_19630 [Bryobacterales bacterium]|nr:hypothetical protein [Bryobacterales bacterium]